MDLADLAGQTYGPSPLFASPDGVRDFVAATGDDPERWSRSAPPGFASVALFAVAPDLLGLLYEHSVIHGEQTYTWLRPFEIGSRMEVRGEVTRSRERGGVFFITFEMETSDEHGTVATGLAGFLAANGSTPVAVEELMEPGATDTGDPAPGQLSASRADLVRYAAATRDWNPIHWDHDAAVSAGLPGVVAHGLLQASWAFRLAAVSAPGDSPLNSARVRFRSPLRPATPVTPHIETNGTMRKVTLSDDTTEYISASIEVAGG
jgi:acyl dehydratase